VFVSGKPFQPNLIICG